MRRSLTAKIQAFTLVEIMVAAGLLAMSTVVMTQSMLVLNRNSSVARVRNLAKAAVLSKVQEAAVVKFDPNADDPITPAPLVVTSDPGPIADVNLGDASAGLGAIPAKLQYTVIKTSPSATDKDVKETRTIRCRVDYTYLGKKRYYEVVTYRSPD